VNKLGLVMHRSKSDRLILLMDEKKGKVKHRDKKLAKLPVSNSIVVTQNMNKIGKVDEVFGPVDRPFVSVKVFSRFTINELDSLKRQEVYTL